MNNSPPATYAALLSIQSFCTHAVCHINYCPDSCCVNSLVFWKKQSHEAFGERKHLYVQNIDICFDLICLIKITKHLMRVFSISIQPPSFLLWNLIYYIDRFSQWTPPRRSWLGRLPVSIHLRTICGYRVRYCVGAKWKLPLLLSIFLQLSDLWLIVLGHLVPSFPNIPSCTPYLVNGRKTLGFLKEKIGSSTKSSTHNGLHLSTLFESLYNDGFSSEAISVVYGIGTGCLVSLFFVRLCRYVSDDNIN